jgi:hypothetical protein
VFLPSGAANGKIGSTKTGMLNGKSALAMTANRAWSPHTTGRDFVDGDRHVGDDGDAIARNFDETLADDEELVAAIFANDHLARSMRVTSATWDG